MTTPFITVLREVASGFAVESPTAFTLLGQRYHHDPVSPATDAGPLHDEAFKRLAYLLYTLLHCRLPLESKNQFNDWRGVGEFTERLSAANTGAGTWQHGWVVRDIAVDGAIGVEKYGIRFWSPRGRVRGTDGPVRVGATCLVRVPAEHRDWIPGFYLALGDADDVTSVEPIVRVYWHVRASGAAAFVALVTNVLNRAGIPFQSKVPNDPLRYGRSDAGVIYLPKAEYDRAHPFLVEVFRGLQPSLRPATSCFAKRLAPGVSVAEDPGDGSSFGQHRADLLTKALCDRQCLAASPADRIDRMYEYVGAAGLDLDRLFLNAESTDSYAEFGIEDPT